MPGPVSLGRRSQSSTEAKSSLKRLRIAREPLLEVREIIHGVRLPAPFGNVKYALEVLDGLKASDVAK
jgi:hypothetical protein